MGIVVFDVRSGLSDGAECFYIPVLADIKMITRSVESASAMADVQVIFREILVFACGGAVNYD